MYTFDEYRRIAAEVKAPIAACAADQDHFAIQPNFSVDEWKKTGIKMEPDVWEEERLAFPLYSTQTLSHKMHETHRWRHQLGLPERQEER